MARLLICNLRSVQQNVSTIDMKWSNIPEKTQEFVTENFSVQILFIG